ncbi:hypothetical protein ACHAXS_005380 [Conticribra weissflogii]
MWYCHSCGFNVDHDGYHCSNCRPYHQCWITREQARKFMKDENWLGCKKGAMKNQWADGTPTGERKLLTDPAQNSNNNNNYFAILQEDSEEDDDDDKTVITSNKSKRVENSNHSQEEMAIETTNATTDIFCNKDWAIGEAAATGTFLIPGAPVKK